MVPVFGGTILALAIALVLSQRTVDGQHESDQPLAAPAHEQAKDHETKQPAAPVIASPAVDGQHPAGAIVNDPTPIDREFGSALALPLAALVGIVALFMIGRRWWSRRQRVDQITELSSGVSIGMPSIPRVLKRPNDEIGHLVDAFNHLLDQIRLRDAAIERHRRDVDRLLAARRVTQVDKSAAEDEVRRQAALLSLAAVDTRAPLTEIIDAVTRLDGCNIPAEQDQIIRLVQSRAQYLLKMSESLAALSATPNGVRITDHIVFQPEELLEAVADTFAERAHLSNVDIMWHAHAVVPSIVRGDAAGIRQALSTLVAEAVNGTELGHVALVECTLDKPDTYDPAGLIRLRLNVKRIGPGMLDGRQSRDAPPLPAGLALAIANHEARAFGGRVEHAMIPGAGSESWISAPVELAQPEAAMQPPPASGRVLVVESSRALREILALRIESIGFTVHSAFGIGAACQVLAEAQTHNQPFDCVIVTSQGEADEFDRLASGFAKDSAIGSTPLIVLTRRQVIVPDSVLDLGGGVTVLRMPLRSAELRRAIIPLEAINTNIPSRAVGYDQPSRHLA